MLREIASQREYEIYLAEGAPSSLRLLELGLASVEEQTRICPKPRRATKSFQWGEKVTPGVWLHAGNYTTGTAVLMILSKR